MQGRRIHPDSNGNLSLTPGDYCKWHDRWMCMTPNGHAGNLGNHSVTEHEDGTITVAPSILVTGHDGGWHGYLERGVWRSV